jgi:hypothetical protein
MNIHAVLLIMAFVVFIVGLLDWPPVSTTRCIALGLALLTLAQMVGR